MKISRLVFFFSREWTASKIRNNGVNYLKGDISHKSKFIAKKKEVVNMNKDTNLNQLEDVDVLEVSLV